MKAALQQHLDAVNLSEFQSHVAAVKAAPNVPAVLKSLRSIWHTVKPLVSIVENFPFIPAKEEAIVVALAKQLDAVCSMTMSPQAVNLQTILTELCSVWQPAKSLVALLSSMPFIPAQVQTIIAGFTTALNTVCATQPAPAA